MSEGVKLDLEGIKARVEAATPGPWTNESGDDRSWFSGEWLIGDVRHSALGFAQDCANGRFITHARQDIPALLTALARLQADVEAADAQAAAAITARFEAEARADAYREALDTIAQWGCDLAEDYDGTCGSKIVKFARAALAGSGSGKERDE